MEGSEIPSFFPRVFKDLQMMEKQADLIFCDPEILCFFFWLDPILNVGSRRFFEV